jgi:hypothetical protein
MELREPIEWINEKLKEKYGCKFGNEPEFRVVFSDDQLEKRLTDFDDRGNQLIYPEVRLLPKYRQYIRSKYILERMIPIPENSELTVRVGYEPAWVFQDKNQNYLPPFLEGCEYVIDAMRSAIDKAGTFTKYKDKNISEEERQASIKKVEDELFGNETDMTDDLHSGAGVSMVNTTPKPIESKLVH